MKFLFCTAALLLASGCSTLRRPAPLTASQATVLATYLANDMALKLYHRQPFQGLQLAAYEAGSWVWTEQRGCGTADIEGIVILAANGLPQKVDVQVLSLPQELIMQLF